MNILEKLFIQYNAYSNNKIELIDKIESIQKQLSIKKPIGILFIGILNDFLTNEPQYYYNRDVEKEVFENLNILFTKNNDKFRDSFYKYQDRFFHAINSYYHILDLYNEFDDVDFDNETKTKIYYLPIITQLMEFCLNHLYRGIAYIKGDFESKNYTSQNTLGKLKNILYKDYPNFLDIDIDLRDAISHGTVEIFEDKLIYSYIEKGTRELVSKELDLYKLNNIKNHLLDIASGAILGLLKFIIEQDIFDSSYLEKQDEKISFELLKMILHNENIKVKSFSRNKIGSSQLNIHLVIKNIDDTNQIIHLLILVSKITYVTFNNYDRYFINYKHPFSIEGFLTLENSKLKNILYEDDISKIDNIISHDLGIMIPDIQKNNLDNRSYKFQIFPKISGKNWEVSFIKDISIEGIKRFDTRLIVDNEHISKREIESLIFQVIKKIKILENKANPITKIKYGKIEADVVRLTIFYKTYKRDSFSLFQDNEAFICLVHYYKSKKIQRIRVGFLDNYNYEQLKKFDIWNINIFDVFWNKRYLNRSINK